MTEHKKEFIPFAKFVIKTLTRVLFKERRKKSLNENEMDLISRLFAVYLKYYK